MKRTVIITAFSILCTLQSMAQDAPSSTTAPATLSLPTVVFPANCNTPEFKQKLVDLAMVNNPETAVSQLEIDRSTFDYKKTGTKWLDYITVSGNMNEFTINPSKYQNQALFFPRYNFGISFSLGSLFAIPLERKIAKKGISSAEAKHTIKKVEIRSAVLSKFEEYMATKELLAVQKQAENDEQLGFNLSERKFKNNQITIEEYNVAAKRYHDESIKRLEMKRDLGIKKHELEKLLGMQIEDNN